MGGGALSPLFSFLLSSVAVLSLCALCSPSPFFLSLYFFLLCFVLLWLFSSLVSFVPLHVRDILFIVETRIFVFIISLSLSLLHTSGKNDCALPLPCIHVYKISLFNTNSCKKLYSLDQ